MNQWRKTALLTAFCLSITAAPTGAFWAARAQASDETAILTVETGSIPSVKPVEAETVVGVMIEIPLTAEDPDGDAVAFKIDKAPEKGTAVIENDKLRYTPAEGKTGTDRFSYCALDTMGNISESAEIKIKIHKNKSKMTYSDMTEHPLHLAALSLYDSGVYTGEKIGVSYFFHPNDILTREEFIAMAVAASGYKMNDSMRTDFADDEALSPWARSYVSTAAEHRMISGCQTISGSAEIRGGDPVTIGEASSILCNMLAPYLDAPVAAVAEKENGWAAPAMAVMTAADVLPEQMHERDFTAHLTRAEACQMLYEAMKIMKS